MKVDSAISCQVLDHLKGSSDRLVKTINQPGEDRCYKGNPLAQLAAPSPRERVPVLGTVPPPSAEAGVVSVVEPIRSDVEAVEVMVEPEPVSPQPPSEEVAKQESVTAADSEQLSTLQQELEQLRAASDRSQGVVDELHQEIGKLVANSRRELVRMGKRLDEVEQQKGSANDSGEENGKEAEQSIAWMERSLESLEQRLEQQITRQGERDEDASCDRLKQLEEAVSRIEQKVAEEHSASADDQMRLQHLENTVANLQQGEASTGESFSWESLEQRITALESAAGEPVSGGDHPQQLELLQNELERVDERISEYIMLEQTRAHEGEQRMEQLLTQLEHLQLSINGMEGELEALKSGSASESATNSLGTDDGREKSIVEELRYEIGEVKKSSNRQLEALSSKLNTLTTSSEVNQIVKYAMTPLQNRMEGMEQQIDKQQQPKPLTGASIRF